jgi:hypothetical protein
MLTRYRLPALLSFPLAAILAVCAAGGIGVPAVYAREHPYWAAQGLGQDWADLLFAAPLLAVAAYFTLRRSRVFTFVLAGALAYTLYSLVLYAFFMHFGPLFLAYTWGLGLAFYAFVILVGDLRADSVKGWFTADVPSTFAGVVAVVLGCAFCVLWLAEVLPALLSGASLKSAADAGLITNPVQVLDLGIVLPAFIVGGVALVRRRPLGYWLAPTLLGFGIVMDVALIGMSVSIRATGAGTEGAPMAPLVVMLVLSVAALAGMLRRLQRAGAAS